VQPNNLPPGAPNFNRFTVQASPSYGIGGGVYLTDNFLFNFDWTTQKSKIDGRLVTGAVNTDLADFNMNTYHFGGQYHFMDPESKLRPYFSFGVGWTGSKPDINGVSTFNRFSGAVGGGVKYFFHKNIGVFGQIRYMPTFVYSEPGGVWCNWYGYCWVVADNNYLHQGDAQFGVSVRF
jgi:outer membrane protein W